MMLQLACTCCNLHMLNCNLQERLLSWNKQFTCETFHQMKTLATRKRFEVFPNNSLHSRSDLLII